MNRQQPPSYDGKVAEPMPILFIIEVMSSPDRGAGAVLLPLTFVLKNNEIRMEV